MKKDVKPLRAGTVLRVLSLSHRLDEEASKGTTPRSRVRKAKWLHSVAAGGDLLAHLRNVACKAETTKGGNGKRKKVLVDRKV